MIKVSSGGFGQLERLEVRGQCPHCDTGTTFTLFTDTNHYIILKRNVKSFIASYICDICIGAIPIHWDITITDNDDSGHGEFYVDNPKEILRSRERFTSDHVSQKILREINEALDCLSVSAYNGFAAMCRRAVQAICADLGAAATAKIERQIKETVQLTGLEQEWQDLTLQIMMTGHDGSHPHLPEVTADRAAVLVQLLQDLTYQLYTRPGKVREAAKPRQEVIDHRRE